MVISSEWRLINPLRTSDNLGVQPYNPVVITYNHGLGGFDILVPSTNWRMWLVSLDVKFLWDYRAPGSRL